MNSLNRTILAGEIVVVRADAVTPNATDRRFQCYFGSGMYHSTDGTVIYGVWVSDNERDYIHGDQIDYAETDKLTLG